MEASKRSAQLETCLKQNSFEIKIAKKENEILIEAENLQNSKLHARTFTLEEVQGLHKAFFSTFEDLYDTLLLGFEGGNENTKASIDNNAKITLTLLIPIANMVNKKDIEIKLHEQILEPIKVSERELAKIQRGNLEPDQERKCFIKLFEQMLKQHKKTEERSETAFENRGPVKEKVKEKGENEVRQMEKEIRARINDVVCEVDKLRDLMKGLSERAKKIEEDIATQNKHHKDLESYKEIDNFVSSVGQRMAELEKRNRESEAIFQQVRDMERKIETIRIVENSLDETPKITSLLEKQEIIAKETNKRIEDNSQKIDDLNELLETASRKIKGIELRNESITKKVEGIEAFLDGLETANQKIEDVENQVFSLKKTVEQVTHSTKESQRLERMIEELRQKQKENIEEFEDTLAPLKNLLEDLEDRVENLQKNINQAKNSGAQFNDLKLFKQIKSEFMRYDDKPVHVLQDDKTLKSFSGITIIDTFLAKNVLPSAGKFFFSVSLERFIIQENSVMAVGIGGQEFRQKKIIMLSGCYSMSLLNKVAHINGSEVKSEADPVKPGDIVHIFVDRDNHLISCKINDKPFIEKAIIDLDSLDSQGLYPFVYVEKCRDIKFSFV